MPTSEIQCDRDGCTNTFRVGSEASARCPACGMEHSAPWPHQQGDVTDEATEETTTTLTAPEGATVRITIEIEPGT